MRCPQLNDMYADGGRVKLEVGAVRIPPQEVRMGLVNWLKRLFCRRHWEIVEYEVGEIIRGRCTRCGKEAADAD